MKIKMDSRLRGNDVNFLCHGYSGGTSARYFRT